MPPFVGMELFSCVLILNVKPVWPTVLVDFKQIMVISVWYVLMFHGMGENPHIFIPPIVNDYLVQLPPYVICDLCQIYPFLCVRFWVYEL